MNGELLLKKAQMQLDRGMKEEALITLNHLIMLENDEDIVSQVQARCMLGEISFLAQKYDEAREHFMWILNQEEELLEEHDDLLNDEIYEADMLLDMMERHGL